jgi:hypothetical protein
MAYMFLKNENKYRINISEYFVPGMGDRINCFRKGRAYA